jgi:hypothetical protein
MPWRKSRFFPEGGLRASFAVDAHHSLSAKTFALSQKQCSTLLYRVFLKRNEAMHVSVMR